MPTEYESDIRARMNADLAHEVDVHAAALGWEETALALGDLAVIARRQAIQERMRARTLHGPLRGSSVAEAIEALEAAPDEGQEGEGPSPFKKPRVRQ